MLNDFKTIQVWSQAQPLIRPQVESQTQLLTMSMCCYWKLASSNKYSILSPLNGIKVWVFFDKNTENQYQIIDLIVDSRNMIKVLESMNL